MSKILYTIFFISIFSSCRVLKQSSFSRSNLVVHGYHNHFFNNKLKFNVNFFGGHQFINPPLLNYIKYTPLSIKSYLRKEMAHQKGKLLYFSYSPYKHFGFYYVGFLAKRFPVKKHFTRKMSQNNSAFFEGNDMKRIDSFLLKSFVIPVDSSKVIFFCFKKIMNNPDIDSLILQQNTCDEFMTLKTSSNFKPYAINDYSDLLNKAANMHGYFAMLNQLLFLKNNSYDDDNITLLNDYIETAYSFFDEISIVIQMLFEQHTFKGNNIKNRSTNNVEVSNQLAIPRILKEAGRQKVMMINESHFDWRHRYFVTLLLDSLFKKGYKYLCLETLSNEKAVNERKFPVSDDGYYCKEPFMANLMRTALAIGYKLVEYEDTTTHIDASFFNSPIDKREYYQALNLYHSYKKDTASKWLIYGGYSHINKSSFSSTEPSTMAKYFYTFSHVNPYSINQSYYSDIFNTKVAVDSAVSIKNYYYLTDGQVNDSSLLKQSDLYMINNINRVPYETDDAGRGYTRYTLKYDAAEKGNREYALQVFLKSEYLKNNHAVPLYIKKSIEPFFNENIWLPKNNYYLIVIDGADKILHENDL